ncbi:MAG: outer membrane protein assembly factor BamE [Phycisphaeraceae bacterium]|nr:outer membrane protein assembly factor BamE [Phycisphaeraceae bacterium]
MAALFALAGCESQHETNWSRLQQGMSKAEVAQILGEPSSRVDARRVGNDVVVAFDRWQYGDNLSTLATGVVFPGEAPDRVWAVYFDEEGNVVDFRPPIRPW